MEKKNNPRSKKVCRKGSKEMSGENQTKEKQSLERKTLNECEKHQETGLKKKGVITYNE